jgi:hypothetical protein
MEDVNKIPPLVCRNQWSEASCEAMLSRVSTCVKPVGCSSPHGVQGGSRCPPGIDWDPGKTVSGL